MAVKLRMTRMGRRHRPFFRINAIDSRTPRDGRILENLGHYDPLVKDKDKQIVIDLEKAKYWLEKGAVPSDTVSDLLVRLGVKHKYAEERAEKRSKAKDIARKKGVFFTQAEKVAAEKVVADAKAKAEADAKAAAEAAKAKAAAEAKAKAEAEAKAKADAAAAAKAEADAKAAAAAAAAAEAAKAAEGEAGAQ